MAKILNIETSLHNEEQLTFALSVEFRRSVYDLSIFEEADRYGVKLKMDGLIGTLLVYVDKNEYTGPNMDWFKHDSYYKVYCDDCVWYLTHKDISDVKGFSTGVANTIREMIKRSM
jgi:hypothetical protein